MATKPIGPGPGAYMLPPTYGYENHDNRKNRRPQYSFGKRTMLKDGQVGPGPGAYKFDKVYRTGLSKTPEYPFGLRTTLKDKAVSPGPAAHNVPNWGPRAPEYSMGLRTYLKTGSYSPAANAYAYSIQTIKNKSPSYSMGITLKRKQDSMSPGPMAYGANDLNITRPKAGQYSMGLRTKAFKDATCAPGANHYNLMEYKPGDSSPGYSFGVRHNQYAPPMIVHCDN